MYAANPRPPAPPNAKTARLGELLDALKAQIDAVTLESSHFKASRDELEHKRLFYVLTLSHCSIV